jgi:hypothetical protein
MRLDMKDKEKVRAKIARRYRQADKTGRGKLPEDEYTVTLDYNRDYLAHILTNRGKTRFVRADGKPVKIIAVPTPQRGRTAGKTASSGRKQGGKPKLTRPGALLRDQIPVRVMFTWDERKPGFFQFDRVAHCGSDASGRFCQTLTGTDAGSGWTEEHALPNSAHRRVRERIQQIRDELPFPLPGIDGDNGGEFINGQLQDRCDKNSIRVTRGRPYRKNVNCFVEQKNGDVVCKTVGYDRFEGQDMCDAREAVYRCLNPLLNYRYPTLRLIAGEQRASGRYKKIYGKVPGTPCRRLLESPEVAEEYKAELRRRAVLFKPVTLKRETDEARKRLLKPAAQRGITGETA